MSSTAMCGGSPISNAATSLSYASLPFTAGSTENCADCSSRRFTSFRLSAWSSARRQRSCAAGASCPPRAATSGAGGGVNGGSGERVRLMPPSSSASASSGINDAPEGSNRGGGRVAVPPCSDDGDGASAGGIGVRGGADDAASARCRHASLAASQSAAADADRCTGKCSVNVAPQPGVLRTLTSPPARRAHAREAGAHRHRKRE